MCDVKPEEQEILNNCGEKGIFVIGTTNRPDLQEAILDKLKTIPSSLTQEQLKEYQEFFNTKSKPSQNRPAIGFTVKRA